jgi:hypothetical protein
MRCSKSHMGDLGECTRSRRWVVAPLWWRYNGERSLVCRTSGDALPWWDWGLDRGVPGRIGPPCRTQEACRRERRRGLTVLWRGFPVETEFTTVISNVVQTPGAKSLN